MNERLGGSSERHWLAWSSLYAAAMLALGVFWNYVEPYSPEPVISPQPWQLILWGSLYLPVLILPLFAGLKVADFGFTLNPFLALAAPFMVVMCAYTSAALVSWRGALVEAFARTGEEVFFRGFLFLLFTCLFRNSRRPWLWAAVASSALFALAHTQPFQPGYLSQYGSPTMPAGYQIAERLVNVFSLALVFALMRVWTRSILPGAIAHSLLAGGIVALPLVLLIYGAITLWAHRRAEPVILRADGLGRLA